MTPSSFCFAMMPDWLRLFPDADFRFSMGLRVGNPASFWRDEDHSGSIVAERHYWLKQSAECYAWCAEEAVEAKREALIWMQTWSTMPEPDWVLLSSGEPHVIAGEVVFPSAWSLVEKRGRILSQVHEPVPELESQMGAAMACFLTRLKVGAAWERENWGFTADAERNHHPDLDRARLGSEAKLDTTWLRLERQFFSRLPLSQCLLFGIRVSHYRLDIVADDLQIRQRLARALATMPEAIADYKGVLAARESLLMDLDKPRITNSKQR